jgi:hypothetical protein
MELQVKLYVEASNDPHLGEHSPSVIISADADMVHLDFGVRYAPGTLGHAIGIGDPRESKRLDVPRGDLRSIVAKIVPDPPDNAIGNVLWSTLTIAYRDPYDVEDAFTLTLSGGAYWVKAARKLLTENGLHVISAETMQ